MTAALALAGLALLAALLYWQLILAEGAYLGRRVVALLYDLSARAYDRIKQFDPHYEAWFLGMPLSRALAPLPDPLVLDVATGTGRLARALFADTGFRGRLIGLDYARRMLAEARRTLRPWADRITLIWEDAARLPFDEATFDAVACLEALEFMPDPDAVLREMVRVLRPGGVLLVTNRIGSGARWMPGRTCPTEVFLDKLRALPLEMIRAQPWQEDYDLVWARKQGIGGPTGLRPLEAILRCPRCGGPMRAERDAVHRPRAFVCAGGHRMPVADDGILESVRV